MNDNTIVRKIMDEFVRIISITLKDFLIEESLDKIRKSDGRARNAPECCRQGSFIYFLYNAYDEIIYIGETGQAVKNRLYSDGSGSHNTKEWFKEVVKLEYYNNKQMDFNSRKLLERALISMYKPKHNYEK